MVSGSVKIIVKLGYRNESLGINTLKKLSQSGGLAREYINHCIKSTTITLLKHPGFESRYIVTCTVGGHRHNFSPSTALTPQVQLRTFFAYITVLGMACNTCTLCLNFVYVKCVKCMYTTGWSCGNPNQCCIKVCTYNLYSLNSDLYH